MCTITQGLDVLQTFGTDITAVQACIGFGVCQVGFCQTEQREVVVSMLGIMVGERIKELGFKVKIDTNGYHPERLRDLADKRLVDYIAMDIKNSLTKYSITTGLDSIDTGRILESISLIMNCGIPYEFRTTAVKQLHKDSDFEDIGRMIEGAGAYYLQKFTERDTVPDKSLTSPSDEDMAKYLEIAKKYVPNSSLRGI